MEFLTQYILGWNAAAIVCLAAGLALLIAEMFTPGMGVSGILGIVALIAAVILRADTLENALVTLAIVIVLVFAAGFFIYRSYKKGALSRSAVVLKEAIEEKSTSLSDAAMQELAGKIGTALTALRPSGNALIEGMKFDVVTSGEFIPKDAAVRVVRVEGLRILVEAVKENV